jgi:hypothetical protein
MNNTIFSSVTMVIKVFAILGLGLYTAFAVVVVRQEQLMANVLEEYSESFLRILTLIHLFAAIGTLVLAIIFL